MSTLRLVYLLICLWSGTTADATERAIRVKLVSSDTVRDTGKVSLLFRVNSDHPLLKEFRILCDPDTHEAISSWWMTKGMFKIQFAKGELKVPPQPATAKHAEITFDHESFVTADQKPITILQFRWTE